LSRSENDVVRCGRIKMGQLKSYLIYKSGFPEGATLKKEVKMNVFIQFFVKQLPKTNLITSFIFPFLRDFRDMHYFKNRILKCEE
jgi:hypothetical protein